MKYTPLFLLLLLSSCLTERRATTQVSKIQVQQPQVLSRFCAIEYPVRVNTKTDTSTLYDTTYIPGEIVMIDCDSLDGKQPCPPPKVVTKTNTITVTKTEENTAAIDSMARHVKVVQGVADKWQAKYERAQEKIDNRVWWIWAAIIQFIILIAGFILKLKKVI
jgi:hypothetical protein